MNGCFGVVGLASQLARDELDDHTLNGKVLCKIEGHRRDVWVVPPQNDHVAAVGVLDANPLKCRLAFDQARADLALHVQRLDIRAIVYKYDIARFKRRFHTVECEA